MNRIRELREEKRLTQLQLSLILGVTQETVSAYENNRHLPSVDILLKLSEHFNVSMDYIMGASDIRFRGSNPSKDQTEQVMMAELTQCFSELNMPNRNRLLGYANGILDCQKNPKNK